MTQYADPGRVEDVAADMPNSYLTCRDLGHNWRPHTAAWVPDENAYERSMRCTRCKTVRWQTLSATGAVLAGHYEYPDGYLIANLGRLAGDSRDRLRLESLRRSLDGTPTRRSA